MSKFMVFWVGWSTADAIAYMRHNDYMPSAIFAAVLVNGAFLIAMFLGERSISYLEKHLRWT